MGKSIATLGLALVLLMALVADAHAEGEGFGIGFIVGEPTGLSAKTWLDGTKAVDGALGWSDGHNDTIRVHMDFLYHNFKLLSELGRNPPAIYLGVGGRARIRNVSGDTSFENDVQMSVRFPVGITYLFREAPLGIFAELVPALDVQPATRFWWGGAAGVRFYFR